MSMRVEEVLAAIEAMTQAELKRLCRVLGNHSGPLWRAGYVITLRFLVDSTGDDRSAFVEALDEQVRKLKRRKSSPRTICRNVEICDLRKGDPRKWSQGKLANRYKVSARLIRKVLTE